LGTFIDELDATRLENRANDFVNTFSRCHCHSCHCHTPAPHTARKTRIALSPTSSALASADDK
jgi:hypothetical protein